MITIDWTDPNLWFLTASLLIVAIFLAIAFRWIIGKKFLKLFFVS